MANTVGKMVAMVLLGRDLAHRAHWKTPSYAEHTALQGFYDGVLDLIDAFVEQYQGQNNTLVDVPLADNDFDGEIADVLEQQLTWLQGAREKVTEDPSLLNTYDSIVGLYQSTLYKLRFLA